eukprot:742271-Ditylum_brightwellii.AAC.1
MMKGGHCKGFGVLYDSVQIGRYDVSNSDEVFETFMVRKEIAHPDFTSEGALENDFMLVQLYGFTNALNIKLNKDKNVPRKNWEPLTVIGWGKVNNDQDSGELKNADELQE